MHIKINLTEDIINQCLELHYGDQAAGKKQKRRLLWIPLMLAIVSAYLIYDELQQPALGQNFIMAILYVGFGISYYVFMKNRMMKAGKRILKSLGPNAKFTININGDDITTKTASATITNGWTAFTGAVLSKGNVLLYQANNTFIMFNHTFFEPGDFDSFKNLVRNHVQPLMEV